MSQMGFRVLKSARSWIGTPYVHQASVCGGGSDCLGLLRGVWRETCGAEPETVPAYSKDWFQPRTEEPLWAVLKRHFISKDLRHQAMGDVLLFRMGRSCMAKHLGIQGQIGQGATFIHAYSGHGVVESQLSAPWVWRIVARFQFPEEGL